MRIVQATRPVLEERAGNFPAANFIWPIICRLQKASDGPQQPSDAVCSLKDRTTNLGQLSVYDVPAALHSASVQDWHYLGPDFMFQAHPIVLGENIACECFGSLPFGVAEETMVCAIPTEANKLHVPVVCRWFGQKLVLSLLVEVDRFRHKGCCSCDLPVANRIFAKVFILTSQRSCAQITC